MRKILLTFMATLLSCSAAHAFWPEATDSSLEIGVGYRRDKLEWKTRADLSCCDCDCDYGSYYGYDSGPFGVRSHLKWDNLRIWQIEGRGKYVTCDNLYFRAYGDYGWIHSGHNKDRDFYSDYYYDDYEFSCSRSKTRGHVYDVNIALGYQFKLCDDSFSIAPVVGYAWKGTHLRDRHLRLNHLAQVPLFEGGEVARSYSCDYCSDYCDYCSYSDSYSCSCSSSSGLHSRYNNRWNGPFLGVDLEYRFLCNWSLFLDYEYHWATYHAKAHWNLRQDLPWGFHHRSKRAYGQVVDFGIKWDFCDCWTVALRGEFQYWCANKGHDRAKIFDASVCDVKTDCRLSIPLRHVRQHTEIVAIDIGMAF